MAHTKSNTFIVFRIFYDRYDIAMATIVIINEFLLHCFVEIFSIFYFYGLPIVQSVAVDISKEIYAIVNIVLKLKQCLDEGIRSRLELIRGKLS